MVQSERELFRKFGKSHFKNTRAFADALGVSRSKLYRIFAEENISMSIPTAEKSHLLKALNKHSKEIFGEPREITEMEVFGTDSGIKISISENSGNQAGGDIQINSNNQNVAHSNLLAENATLKARIVELEEKVKLQEKLIGMYEKDSP